MIDVVMNKTPKIHSELRHAEHQVLGYQTSTLELQRTLI